jgi:LAO/AO transport system kinase
MLMDDAKLKEMITEKSEDGKLSCQDAHLIAEKFGIHLSLVGKACNEEGKKVKITECLLGCF